MDDFFIQHAKSERVKSSYSQVNLRLIVGDVRFCFGDYVTC